MAQGHPRKKRRVACVECRQSKIRCDPDVFPCPRCTRLGLDCRKDERFRRMNRSSQIEQLENQVKQLRQVSGFSQTDHSGSTSGVSPAEHASSAMFSPSASRHNHDSPASASSHNTTGPYERILPRHKQSEPYHPYTLGEFSIDSAQAGSLFNVYFEKYHVILPFLNQSLQPEALYRHSRLLFWVIIATGARQYKVDPSIPAKLYPVLQDLIWKSIRDNYLPLTTIQALILVCNWPIAFIRASADISLTLIAVACTAAKVIGLHRPGKEYEYTISPNVTVEGEPEERLKTWVACTITSHGLAVEYGHDSPVSLQSWPLAKACEQASGPNALPDELRHQLVVQTCSDRFFERLSMDYLDLIGLPPPEERVKIIAAYDKEATQILQEYGDSLSFSNRFLALALQMRIRLMHFVAPPPAGLSREGILQAYSSAMALILHIISDNAAYNVLPHMPLTTARTILGAVVVMWRVLNSNFADGLDRNHGKTLFHSAAFALKSLAYHDNDVAARGARATNRIWQMGEDQPELRQAPPLIRVNSRKSASLMWDAFSRIMEYKDWAEKVTRENKSNRMPGASSVQATNATARADATSDLAPQHLSYLPQTSSDPDLWMSVPDLDWLWETNLTGLFDL